MDIQIKKAAPFELSESAITKISSLKESVLLTTSPYTVFVSSTISPTSDFVSCATSAISLERNAEDAASAEGNEDVGFGGCVVVCKLVEVVVVLVLVVVVVVVVVGAGSLPGMPKI